ncbi:MULTISPECIES: hypothetical protein [Corynebacterium]|uniref:hypothetical protein n=1 Tax=Corynebacterium TaxID=1716 RepID=UPI000EBA8D9D|nr:MULTISPECIES: hypothetical protein [Corynebacterium]MDN6098547.1 hypothetical protein [Corynebacterium flavescens]MDN6200068.1 hypothetical protein [Corynebacterium flavescens]MDN6226482.1 hypothetical protein [Corynebacterium flavescens]MDN6236185.1 hypothetical protein [Corynebacterium flavescens]MDN6431543.1 hypothetical protein [Corynebacterium flavescens]
MTTSKSPAQGVPIPTTLRVGGAFMFLAFVLILLAVISVFRDGWQAPFTWTYGTLAIVAAALIAGAFATIRRDQRASKTQVIALAVAVVLVIAGRFAPSTVLVVMDQYWLLLYAVGAGLCALILRRVSIGTH